MHSREWAGTAKQTPGYPPDVQTRNPLPAPTAKGTHYPMKIYLAYAGLDDERHTVNVFENEAQARAASITANLLIDGYTARLLGDGEMEEFELNFAVPATDLLKCHADWEREHQRAEELHGKLEALTQLLSELRDGQWCVYGHLARSFEQYLPPTTQIEDTAPPCP